MTVPSASTIKLCRRHSFFLRKEPVPGYLSGVAGVYRTPRGGSANGGDVEEVDREFSYKEKPRLPGQIFCAKG